MLQIPALILSALLLVGAEQVGDSPVPRQDSCGECLDMMGGGGPGHSFQWGGQGTYMGSHVNWLAGWCAGSHGSCIPEEPEGASELNSLEPLVHAGDILVATSVVLNAQDRVLVNRSRRAIQLVDCAGQVVGHYPVGLERLAD